VSPNLRDRLRGDGPPLLGTFVIVPRIEVVEIVALAGFDLVVLDQEHGPLGIETLPPLVAAAEQARLACVVRVPECRAKQIESALDVGADGVLVPHVSSAASATEAVAASRFAPEGRRGVNPYVRAGAYGTDPRFVADANARAACLAMVEGKEGVAAIGEILAVPGLDAVFVGPVDLSASLGVPGEPEHPLVVETVRGLVDRGRESDVATGVFAPTPEAACRWLDVGARLVALSIDTAMMLDGMRAAVAQVSRR
jgi:4-hydroxy-2-oxoheptanedioate aldolase